MLMHCVFCRIRPEVAEAEVAAVFGRLADIGARIDGTAPVRHGPNRDYEGRSPGYTHGFVMTFRDRDSHLRYDTDPEHRAAGAALVALCEDGVAGLAVFDIESG